MQRLSQMVLDMQARMTDMSSNLRLDFQEDASKMLVTLLNGAGQPASATGAEAQTVRVHELAFAGGSAQMNEAMSRISQVADDLESRSDALQDLAGRLSRHDEQLHLLMEERGQSRAATPSSSSSSSTAAAPVGDLGLKDYLDEKMRALREELMEGMDIKMADLKNSCDYKILSVVQEQCEGQESNYFSLAELLESKESDLRKEIQDLRVQISAPGVEATPASVPLLARVENLEVRLNSSEKTGCPAVEEKLKAEWAEANRELRKTVEDKLASVEDTLNSLLTDTSSVSPSTDPLEHQDAQPKDLGSVKESVQRLQGRFEALERQCSHGREGGVAEDLKGALGDVDGRIRRLEGLCGRLEPVAESVRGIGDGLSRHVAGLWDLVGQLNATVVAQARDVGALKGACQCIPTAGGGDAKALTDNNPGTTGEQQGVTHWFP